MSVQCCGETGNASRLESLKYHPCFSREAHHKYGRVHMPVAPACNIQCRYCVRKFDCANESRPGISSRLLSHYEAIERVRSVTGRDERVRVVGVAGPGDPLANRATFEFMGLVHSEFPELSLCLSTNGLLLPDRLDELVRLGLKTITVTINALDPKTAEAIYAWVRYDGKTYRGREAAELLIGNQWIGLRAAVAAGLAVKVNTICLPGINETEIPCIAEKAGEMGATIMNIMSLIPQGEFAALRKPSIHEIARLRYASMPYLPMMTHCRQCRADATGLLGEDKDMETEALLAMIGEEYMEQVV